MNAKRVIFIIGIIVLIGAAIYFGWRFYFSKKYAGLPPGAYFGVEFDPTDWKVEGEPKLATARLRKGTGMLALRFNLISHNGWQGKVSLVDEFPQGVNYELIPAEMNLTPDQTLPVVLRIGAEKDVREDKIEFNLQGFDKSFAGRILLEEEGTAGPGPEPARPEEITFKEFQHPSGLKVKYPEAFIIAEIENLESLIPREIIEKRNLKLLLLAVDPSGRSQLSVSESEFDAYLTADQVFEELEKDQQLRGIETKILSAEGDERSVIVETELVVKGSTFRTKEKLIFVRVPGQSKMKVYGISILTTPDDYSRYLPLIDEIIQEAGF